MMKRFLAAAAALAMAVVPLAAVYAQSNDGFNRMVRVENRSNTVNITSVLMENPNGQVFRPLAAGSVISPGYNRILNFDDGQGHCYYNIRADFANGRVAYQRNVNVCQATVWSIYDLDNQVHYGGVA
jgi:hypothetical protein